MNRCSDRGQKDNSESQLGNTSDDCLIQLEVLSLNHRTEARTPKRRERLRIIATTLGDLAPSARGGQDAKAAPTAPSSLIDNSPRAKSSPAAPSSIILISPSPFVSYSPEGGSSGDTTSI